MRRALRSRALNFKARDGNSRRLQEQTRGDSSFARLLFSGDRVSALGRHLKRNGFFPAPLGRYGKGLGLWRSGGTR